MEKISVNSLHLIKHKKTFATQNLWAGFPPFSLGNSPIYNSPIIINSKCFLTSISWKKTLVYSIENQKVILFSKIPSEKKISEILKLFQLDFTNEKLGVFWDISQGSLIENLQFLKFLREEWYKKSEKTLSVWIKIDKNSLYLLPFISFFSAEYLVCNNEIFDFVKIYFPVVEVKTISK